MELIDKLRALVLRWALPEKQYFIQCDGLHSILRPIMKPIMSKTEEFDGEDNEDDNDEQPVH